MTNPTCRFCQSDLTDTLVDLGESPLANSYLSADQLDKPEKRYPLRAWVCPACFLVQLEAFETPEQIFCNDAYFSSYSAACLAGYRQYARDIVQRFSLDCTTQVIELASNDGYLLQYFLEQGLGVLGVEPIASVAEAAQKKGVPTEIAFFGETVARNMKYRGLLADLLIGNNVLPYVPDLNDFVAGMKLVLSPEGIVTMEFPHLLRLMEQTQFDTIYHEHFSYFSLTTAEKIFAHHGLRIFDVDELPTHGGSLRIFACHDQADMPEESSVATIKQAEADFGLGNMASYRQFQPAVERVRDELCEFLQKVKDDGQTIAGYGAPVKGNTLLNYCGIGPDLLPFTVDRNDHKQGMFLPGTHIPILAPHEIIKQEPNYMLILPWNLRQEIIPQMAAVESWNGRFVVPIPQLEVLE